jgi:hypothetical protein
MAVNKYFNHFNYAREQDLVEDLTIESIKIYGHDVKYVPRTIVAKDNLYGDDSLSTYDNAADVEMYIKNVEGFEGEGDLLSRFGLQIRDEITFTLARKRFDQIRSEKLMTEVGYNLLMEDASTTTPSRQFLTGNHETESIVLEEGTGDGYSITSNRPNEGDLIYFPMVDKTFEIKHVEHETLFYQTGRLQTYDLRCELFEYSSESIDTGIAEIDEIEDSSLLAEDGGSLMQEYTVEATDAQANNNLFTADILSGGIVDFSEDDPWSEGNF